MVPHLLQVMLYLIEKTMSSYMILVIVDSPENCRAVYLFFLVFFVSCLYEVAPEQKARSTYDNILRVVRDYDVCEPIRFLRERELVHYQRFGELLRITQEKLDSRNFYAFNPAFDPSSLTQSSQG